MGEALPRSEFAIAHPRASPVPLRLRLFDEPALFSSDRPVPVGRRGRAILAYLAVEPDHRARRERLCGLLWPDRGDAQARASLRQCLTELRGVASALIASDREWVWLKAEAYRSDHADLVSALASEKPHDLLDALTAAGALPLLHGLNLGEMFDDWTLVARAALDRRLSDAVAAAVEAASRHRDWPVALGLADAWLARDPLDERVVALAIRADRLREAPAAAQRRARALANALTREGLPPPGQAIAAALDGELADTGTPARADPAAPAKPSLAILPLANLSGTADRDFADGLAEELSLAFSRFSSLFVVAGRGGTPAAGTTPQAIAAELGVRYLLEGSVRQSAGRVRVTIKVVDGSSGEQIWGDRFDGDLADLLDLQDRVASQVASVIDSTITDAEMHRAARDAVPDSAYDLNLRANAKLNNFDRASIEEALALAERAAALDPDYAWAAATAAFCHAALFLNQWTDDPRQARVSAAAFIDRATRLGRDDLMALPVTAGAILNISGDPAEARRLLERAMELNPAKAFTIFWMGWLELLSDRPDLALKHFEKAHRLDPRSTYRPFQLTGIGNCLFLMERYEEAAAVQREIVSLVPGYIPPPFVLAASLARLGRIDEAAPILARARRRTAPDPVVFRVPAQQARLREALALMDTGQDAPPARVTMALGS